MVYLLAVGIIRLYNMNWVVVYMRFVWLFLLGTFGCQTDKVYLDTAYLASLSEVPGEDGMGDEGAEVDEPADDTADDDVPDDAPDDDVPDDDDIDSDGDGIPEGEDCDDGDPDVFPGAEEICDGLDNNCDGTVDEGLLTTAYSDADGDGYGDPGSGIEVCGLEDGLVEDNTDCNDENPAVHPDQEDICDGVDNDCDSETDEDAELVTWYLDDDGDGFGDSETTFLACGDVPPEGYAARGDDCDLTDPTVNPDAPERCDDIDNDCNGIVDDGVTSLWYEDADGDGRGHAGSALESCDPPAGYVDSTDDCDDTDPLVSPFASETCNGIDDDCDGSIDEDDALDASTWYLDEDSDGYGSSTTRVACDEPTGHTAVPGDCDDTEASINPDADEQCNAIDDDCDGLIDTEDPDLTDAVTYYIDYDGDGFGSSSYTETACDPPDGYVADDSDCDDLDADIRPDAIEVCNGLDDNCDGDIGWYELDTDDDGRLACNEALWLETSRSSNNDPTASAAYGSLEAANLLLDHGVRTTSAVLYGVPITPELLSQYGILVLYGQGYDGPFTSDEAAELEAWVYEGGRLLYMGGWGSGVSCATTNSLPPELGISCAVPASTWSGVSVVTSTHPVVESVYSITGLGGEKWSISSPSETLAAAGGWPVVTVGEYGSGRIVGLSDEWMMYNTGTRGAYDISALDHRILIDNIWIWLSDFEF